MRLASACLATLAIALLPHVAAAQSDQFRQGEAVFARTCAMCHGPAGRGGAGYANPIWGAGAQIAKFKTALGLFEYNQMLMPFDNPARVSDADKWAVSVYILANHGTVPASEPVDPGLAGSVAIR